MSRPVGSPDRHGAARRLRIGPRDRAPWAAFFREFGLNLRRAREERGIAASELAAAIHVHVSTVFQWEQGGKSPLLVTLLAVAAALNCTLRDLLPDEADEHVYPGAA